MDELDKEEAWLQRRRDEANKDLDKWRVVGTDNFNRDNVSDYLHSSYETKAEAEAKRDKLNADNSPNSACWYRVFAPGTKLYLFEP